MFLLVVSWSIWLIVENRRHPRKKPALLPYLPPNAESGKLQSILQTIVSGGSNPREWRRQFCPNCGEEIGLRAIACSRCGSHVIIQEAGGNTMKCPSCASFIPTKSAVCPWCRNILKWNRETLKTESINSIAGGIIVLAILWLGLLIYCFAVRKASSDSLFLLWISLTAGSVLGISIGISLEGKWGQKLKGKPQFLVAFASPKQNIILRILSALLIVSGFILVSHKEEAYKILAIALLTMFFCLLLIELWVTLRLALGKWPRDQDSPPGSLSSSGKAGA